MTADLPVEESFMNGLKERCRQAFTDSRKLQANTPNAEQLANIEMRLRQIFTERELERLDDQSFVRQVERVWPIARYVDQPA